MPLPPQRFLADWYPDPDDPAMVRYWDGHRWTEHVARRDELLTPAIGGGPSTDAVAPNEKAPRSESPGCLQAALLAVLAGAAQFVVLFITLLLGLTWSDPTHIAALTQAALAFVPLAWLAARRRKLVLLVPMLSAALTAGLATASQVYGAATACSDQERAAVQPLAPPPGTTVEFEGEDVEGCVARAQMGLSNEEILEHYRAEFARLGWQETPDRQETTIGITAVKDGIQVDVDIEEQTLEIAMGDPNAATACLINRVDDGDFSLPRDQTSDIEPGQWLMLVSSDERPASVVIRDNTGAVVFERQAHSRPDNANDWFRLELDVGGFPTLSLDEGSYEVECRPSQGAATTVPLRVASARPGRVDQDKSVVIRVSDTPDHSTGSDGG